MEPLNPDEKLTPSEVAAEFKIALATLTDMRSNGEGPTYYKLGPSRNAPVRYLRRDVDLWFNKGRVELGRRRAS